MKGTDPLLHKIKEITSDAIRYWEKGRIIYNAILASITISVFFIASPSLLSGFWVPKLPPLFVLAVIANVLYCLAYPIDVFVQFSIYQDRWKKVRWILFLLGTLIASLLAYFTSMNLFSVPVVD